MKVLYLTNQLALHGGVEHVTALKINGLVDKGFEVYLSTYEQGNRPFVYSISNKVKWSDLGINYNINYIDESPYSFKQIKKVPNHIRRSKKLIQDIRPDIIIVPYSVYEFWFVPFIKGNAKIIKEYHDSQYKKTKIRWFEKQIITKLIDDSIQRLYDRTIVLTPQEIGYFKYKKNLDVIPNPIDCSEQKSKLTEKKIITIGRIAPVKGFDHFIEVAERVHQIEPKWLFEIYGGGPDVFTAPLQKMIREKRLDKVVFLKGETNNVFDVLSNASIYLCTSSTESFGLTLVEAMEAGLPVVSFDCPNGPKNIINDGADGFLIPLGDVDAMSAKILQLIKDDTLRIQMGGNAINNAKKFHVDNIVKMWSDLFKCLQNGE